ncbi:MAG: threonine--tRNA ligase [Candidatus Bipolaricaulota bacterium]|nr:threonine--tRNA ligase [Candidatus Bipolaricaulota bacterium]MDW8126706.1 threonine--tRNA ligase [Candidatus Bipolaricaulota bacterium]
MARVILPSGETREAQGITFLELIHQGNAAAVLFNGKLLDLREPVPEEGEARVLTTADPEALEVLRHTAAHILAHAVTRLFPGTKLAIGPAIADGFYYDFLFSEPISHEDLARIEEEMKKIVEQNIPLERVWIPRAEAERLLRERSEVYKLELLSEIPGEEISFYRQGEFLDLCRGPHLPSTGLVQHFKLLDLAGAYWRGDPTRDMLTRIYGTAFATEEELEKFLRWREEARRRDHRALGPQLDLFSIQNDMVGAGLVLWHPRGARIRRIIEDFWVAEHYKAGYQLVYTPHIGRSRLWQTSGHLDFYRESMYAPIVIEGQEFFLKPMNCPFHIAIYKTKTRSYRELPLRYCELGTVYRFERSGVLHGLLRVRGFTQDDAHIICRPDQVEEEIRGVLRFALYILRSFGFAEFTAYLSTRPEKFIGDVADWDRATEALRKAVEGEGLAYQVKTGEGAFYGPKIDIEVQDSLKRPWQLTTIQFDFNLPERFDMTFVGPDGRPHRPYMIHRALLGSLERFFGILVEHYGGAFPVWLAPVQVVVLPVSEAEIPYAEKVAGELLEQGIRAEAWTKEGKTLRWLVREAQLQKIPYILVCGPREAAEGKVALRLRTGEDQGPKPLDEVVLRIRQAVCARTTGL